MAKIQATCLDGTVRALAVTIGGILALIASASASPTASKAKAPDMREELHCLALNIYFEARSEPDRGKIAVGHVVLNRVKSKRFPGTICGVVRDGGDKRRHRCQFSWYCDGKSDVPRNRASWRHAKALAQEVYWGLAADPTLGALFYHAHYVTPRWRTHFIKTTVIGQHVFYVPIKKLAVVQDVAPLSRLDR